MSHIYIFTVIAIRHDALPEYSELVYPVHIQGECLRRGNRIRRQYQELCSETFYHDKKKKDIHDNNPNNRHNSYNMYN